MQYAHRDVEVVDGKGQCPQRLVQLSEEVVPMGQDGASGTDGTDDLGPVLPQCWCQAGSQARGDRIRCLGVSEFGQSSDLADAYALHEIDCAAITDAALGLIGR